MDLDQTKIVEEFKSIAAQFCALEDASNLTDRNDFLTELYLILPDLIKGAARLPEESYDNDLGEDDFAPEPPTRVPVPEWKNLYEGLKVKLAPNDMYWIVPDCWDNKESQGESLADDIADIYRDLKKGIGEKELDDMVYIWRLNFYHHWGDHAVCALKAIHELVSKQRRN
jgi:hypothetical protein